jgi:hypothetical protein
MPSPAPGNTAYLKGNEMDGVFIVAVDYDQKNAVRGVYRAPEGMAYEAAEAAVAEAYAKAGEDEAGTNPDAFEFLEPQGFDSVSFLTTEVS